MDGIISPGSYTNDREDLETIEMIAQCTLEKKGRKSLNVMNYSINCFIAFTSTRVYNALSLTQTHVYLIKITFYK